MPGKYWQVQSITHNMAEGQLLFDFYDQINENSVQTKRFKQKDILHLISKRSHPMFESVKIGESYEQRPIYMLKAGTGAKKLLIWTQMHGDESTGTAAVFDMFNFLESPGEFRILVDLLLRHCSLYFIPMLNPDGAERFQRRNAQDIDINRDALKLATPEGRLLNRIVDELQPDFGFNMHDQDIWYTAGNSPLPATLSFLTPSFDYAKTKDQKRTESMQLIVTINNALSRYIPGQIARYYDDYMPAAFGDQIQKKGVRTILVESGGYLGDQEKQFVRKLNFLTLIYAFQAIADEQYKNESVDCYGDIPFNVKNKLFDYILRQVRIKGEHGEFKTDIGIRSRLTGERDLYYIDDIGDLSGYYAYKEKTIDINIKQLRIGEDALFIINEHF
jgi:hypothetical protein